jgi:outer membrane protein OmpA-like peptidoglycan-associated protein
MRAVAGVAVVAALLVSGACAKAPRLPEVKPPSRDDLYVLLPDQLGQTGALSVTHGEQTRVLDTPHAATSIKEPGRIETRTVTPEEVRRAFGPALSALPPRPTSLTLYFLEGRDEFTAESRHLVQSVLAEIGRRPAPEVIVIGHTDRVGTVQFNDALSLRRAERARDELVKAGVPADRIQIEGRGEREPLIPTADEVPEPRNRRVEISIR